MHSVPDGATFLINGGETVLYYRDTGESELSLGDVFSLLEARRRRCVLYALSDAADEVVAFERLRDEVRELEQRCQGAPDVPESVTISLEHVHLPRLHEANLVEWDRDAREIEYVGHPLVERWLRETQELDIRDQ